jgi:hypothetical protein
MGNIKKINKLIHLTFLKIIQVNLNSNFIVKINNLI